MTFGWSAIHGEKAGVGAYCNTPLQSHCDPVFDTGEAIPPFDLCHPELVEGHHDSNGILSDFCKSLDSV